jgi:hypothetical protein
MMDFACCTQRALHLSLVTGRGQLQRFPNTEEESMFRRQWRCGLVTHVGVSLRPGRLMSGYGLNAVDQNDRQVSRLSGRATDENDVYDPTRTFHHSTPGLGGCRPISFDGLKG